MRTLRSFGATISTTPLFLSFWPIRQWRPSWTPKSSIEVPCSDLSVTTTSWSVVLASSAASLSVRAARAAGSRILASSTTRPLSVGNSSAAAEKASSSPHSAGTSARPSPPSPRDDRMLARKELPTRIGRSELHLRRPGHVLGHREGLHRLFAPVQRRGPDHARERAQLRVVLPHRVDVVAPRHRDAILRALELRLQCQEVLIRFEIGIALRDREQPPERAGELLLRLLEALECFRIVEDVGRKLHLRGAGAGIGDLFEHLALLRRVALHGLDQIGNEIGAALVLVEHVRPLRLGGLLEAREVVAAAARQQQAQAGDQDGNARATQYARCVAHDDALQLRHSYIVAHRPPRQPAGTRGLKLKPSPRRPRRIIAMAGRGSAAGAARE